jgi:hypothetical protein
MQMTSRITITGQGWEWVENGSISCHHRAGQLWDQIMESRHEMVNLQLLFEDIVGIYHDPRQPDRFTWIAGVKTKRHFCPHRLLQLCFRLSNIEFMLSGAIRLPVAASVIFLVAYALLLLPSAACQDKTMNKTANEQLFTAAQENNIVKMKLALKNGAYINARTETGQTVLHFIQDPHLAKFIIEKGANVNLKDYDFEMTPIYFHSVVIAQLLHKAGADVNARAKKGITPLMWYTYSNYIDGIKFLIANGAHVNIVNAEGSTALDIAIRFEHRESTGYLRSVGAKTATELGK